MKKSLFGKMLAVLLLISLVFGPGVVGTVAAMPLESDHGSVPTIAVTHETDHPCDNHTQPNPDKAKATTCADACQSTSQATIFTLETVPVRYAVRLAFDRTSHIAHDRTGPPDSPPPRL